MLLGKTKQRKRIKSAWLGQVSAFRTLLSKERGEKAWKLKM